MPGPAARARAHAPAVCQGRRGVLARTVRFPFAARRHSISLLPPLTQPDAVRAVVDRVVSAPDNGLAAALAGFSWDYEKVGQESIGAEKKRRPSPRRSFFAHPLLLSTP